MELSGEQIRERFKEHGLRTTRQRELLYSILWSSTCHPTAEELFQTVRATDPGLSLATVYNTLEALLDCKLCRKLNPCDGGPARFDADLSEHGHVAMGDGRFVDIPEDLSRELLARLGTDLVAKIEERMGVKVESVNLQLIAAGVKGEAVEGVGEGTLLSSEVAEASEPDQRGDVETR